MFTAFPLLAIPVFFYNLFALTKLLGVSKAMASESANSTLTSQLMSIPMPGGAHWVIAWGDVFILLSLILLFFELIRSTHTDKVAIINHSLSLILFIVCLVEFLLMPGFATSTFFLISTMTLLDVLAGFIVTIVSARKDFEFTGARRSSASAEGREQQGHRDHVDGADEELCDRGHGLGPVLRSLPSP